jgi:hypothetical protein
MYIYVYMYIKYIQWTCLQNSNNSVETENLFDRTDEENEKNSSGNLRLFLFRTE